MKNFKLFIMLLLVSEMAFTYCGPVEEEKKNISKLLITRKENGAYIYEYTIGVSAKNWQMVSCSERFIDVPIPEVTESILEEGLVMVYLVEGDKYLALPFNYYQVRSILSFQPSFESGHVYINIYGNFIVNVNAKYEFKILIISKEILKRKKKKNWNDYEPIM